MEYGNTLGKGEGAGNLFNPYHARLRTLMITHTNWCNGSRSGFIDNN